MKSKFMEITIEELSGIEGVGEFMLHGIDEVISYLRDEEGRMDEFEFEQNILYYFNCKNENERK